MNADRIEPGPLPFPEGEPERGEDWCPAGVPPDGFEFLGAKPSLEGWFYPCPSCCTGWCRLVPDGTPEGYRIMLEVGCSHGCDGPLIAWWHAWRNGELPPRAAPTETQRRYARGAIRRALSDALGGKDVMPLARDAGRFITAAGINPRHLAEAFAKASKLPPDKIEAAILTGAATPARLANVH